MDSPNCEFLENTATQSGGAIYNNGGNLNLNECTFDGNDLTQRNKNGWGGAAIYDNAGTVTMVKCEVTNNLKDIVHRGGTGVYAGDLSSAAVTSTGTLSVSDCTFEKNSGCYGGAILSNGDNAVLTVSGSTFTDNFAFNGGAIDFTGNKYTITDSTFKGNKARGTGSSNSNYAHGGAISSSEKNDDCVISDCIFEDNSAVMGGAISSTNNQIIGCNFTNNSAKSEYSENFNGKENNRGGFGSAIYSDASMTIDDSNFTDNPNERNNGAVYARDAKITDSSFTNSVIYVNRGPLTVSNNQYDNEGVDISGGNSPKVNFDGVGDVPNVKSANLYSDVSSFADLKALIDSGSTATIFLTSDVTKLDSEGETFADGILIDRSITINADGHTIDANNGKVFTVAEGAALTLRNANVVGDGTNAIVNNGQVTLSLSNPCTFSNVGEYAIDNKGRVTETSLTTFTQLSNLIGLVNGGEVYIGFSKITKADDEKETFKDGIVIENDVTLIGYANTKGVISTYIDADNDGRIFSINDGADVILDTLILKNGNAEKGGAVYVEAGNILAVNKVEFINNTAVYRGGAIYSEGTVNVANSVFDSNDITFRTKNDDNGGAAVYNYNGVLSIVDSHITNNLKDIVIRNGNAGDLLVGVVVTSGETVIKGSYFANNTGSWGGAISSLGYLNDNEYTLTVMDSKFEGNNATFGGAIYVESANLIIDNSTFENNKGVGVGSSGTSNTQGGAIVVHPAESSAKITDSTFIGNSANTGGAVSFAGVDTDSIIDNCTFTDNTANDGGAVYLWTQDEAAVTVANSRFSGNTADWGSAISTDGTLKLSNNTISGTSADIGNWGGSIISEINVVILNNETVDFGGETLITAKVTDDKDNLLIDRNFEFVIDETNIPAVFDSTSGLYQATYTNDVAGVYLVNITYLDEEELVVKTATLRNVKGTFTDLQNLINNAQDNLVLPYDFTYNAEIDGEALKSGVAIDKSITVDGNGSTIDGTKVARIYQLNADEIIIINTTFINGYSNDSSKKYTDWGGAIYSNGANINQVISDCKFYNNTAYNGGAIYLAGDNGIITDCEFEDNDANASGGAVFVYGWSSKIVDSTFKVNGAHELGGAVACYSDRSALILNSDFVGNVAGQSGGAVSMQKAAGQIIDSNFTVNVAPNGAAVYWGADGGNVFGGEFTGNIAEGFGGAIFAAGTGLTINSTFIKNTAENGGAVAVFKDVSITESNFTENSADNYGGAVFVNEGAELDITKSAMKDNKATVGSSIYSIGTMASTIVNATILNNKTWNDTGLGDIYTLNATLTDDMGNNIHDPSFRFTVNGVVIDEVPLYDEKTGLYTVEYGIETAGLNVISTSYDADNLEIFTGALDVSKANVTKFAVTVPDVLEGDNASVWITLTGIDETGLDAIVTVIVNNKEYSVPVEDGIGDLTIEGLDHGQYSVVAMFDDINYNPAINSTVFYVKGQSKLNVAEVTTAEYGDVIEVTINLTDSEGNPISGVVEIDDVFKVLVYEDGIGTFVIDNQPGVGNYTFQAVYDGNDDYFGDLTIFNVTVISKVIDPNDVVVDIPNINEFGDEIPVTITAPVDGTYTVNINGTVVNVEVVNGTGSANVTLDKAGIYNATVDIAEDGYSLETITTDEFEYFKVPEFNAVITGTYPNAEISITGPAGTYHVSIDGRDTIDIVREESGLPTINTINGIDAGNYTAFVGIDGQGEYYGALKDVNFTVNKADLTVDPTVVGDKVIDNTINITFTLPLDVNPSNVHAMIDGIDVPVDDFTINETTGAYTLTVSFPIADGHVFTVDVNDPNYEESIAQATFLIEKITPEITVSDINAKVDATVDATVTIGGGDATGYVLFNGMAYKVENGKAIIPVTVTKAGMQSINVTYLGDDKYANGTGVKAFNANKAATEIKLSDSEITVTIGSDVEVKYRITPNVSEGNVTLWIDDGENVTTEISQSTGSIIILPEFLPNNGTCTIKVQYVGTSNYEDSENDTLVLNVVKVDINDKITVEPVTIAYGENATVIVEGFPENATGNVTVTVNDKSYKGEVENGAAEVVIPDLAANTYEDVSVEYSGDDVYNATIARCAVYVNKASSKVTIFVIGDQPYPGNFSIGYLVDNETEVTITVNGPNGDEIAYEIKEGNVELTNLPAGEYYITIENKESENFTGSEAVVSFKVYKADPTFTSEVTQDAKVGENVTITVKVNSDAVGNVSVSVDGEIFVTDVPVVDGVATVDVSGLDAGHHSYEVTYNGDDNYETASDMNSFDVAKAETVVTIDVDDNLGVMGGSKVNITVSNNVAGYLAIDNNGVISVVEITDGKYSFEIYDLQAGDYYIDATFLGNDNYLESNSTKQFEIPKSNTTPIVVGYTPEIYGGEQAVVNISMDNNFATGLVRIYVDGEEVGFGLLDDNANATFLVNDLTNGTHTIGVKYVGDSNFNESDIVNVTVHVVKSDSKVTIAPITNVTVGNDVVIYYNVENYTFVKVEFTNPNDEIIVDYELFDDRIVVHNLTAGDYEVKVYNTENDFYNADADVALFSVNKIDISDKITIEPVTIAYGENATVIVEGFPENATGNVTVTVNDKSYKGEVENGAAEVVIPDLAANTYEDVSVEYSGDDVYNATIARCAVYVNKASSKVTIFVIGDQPYPGNFSIGYLVDNETEVNITVNGPNGDEIAYEIKEGNVELTNLPAGEYYITIENKESENFTGYEAVDSFKVYKADPTFTSDVTEDAKVGEPVIISVKVNSDAAGNVSVVVDGEIFATDVPVVDGVATVDVSGLDAGHHSYEVTYNGDDNYETASDMNSFDIEKLETTVTIEVPSDVKVGDDATVDVSIPGATGNVSVIVDGVETVVALDENGTASVPVDTSAGEHSVVVVYDGDDAHAPVHSAADFNVEKQSTEANVTLPIDYNLDDIANVTVDIPGATGNVSVIVDGIETVVPLDENGSAVVPITASAGEHSIVVVYPGDDTYAPIVKSSTMNVEVFESKFVNITADGNLTITATLVNSLGDAIANATIVYSVGNVTNTVVTDANGVFTIQGANNEQIVIGYEGEGAILGTNTSMIFNDVAPVAPTPIESRFNIHGNSITITGYAVDTKAGEQGMLYATELLDSNGNPIANVPIQFAVNNKIYNRTTLENGSFNPYHLDMIRAGRYTLALSFGGNENYTSTFAVACIDLDKKPLTIKASAKTYKASAKTKKYTIKLSTIVGSSLDGKAHLRSGLKVTLSINGKDYTSKINAKGQATFNLKLTKKGKYTAKITTNEDRTYETTTKSVKITIK